MLEKLKQLIEAGPKAFTDGQIDGFDKQKIAAAALMVRQARIDSEFEDVERDKISSLIQDRFELSPEATDHLIDISAERNTHVLHPWIFTAALNEAFDKDEKIQLIGMMWQVALADGVLDPFEEDLVNHVAEYLSVSKADRDAARLEASRA